MPLGGSATYEEIAAHTQLPASLVRRILRYAISIRLFAQKEPNSDSIVHTGITAHAARNPQFCSWIAHISSVNPAAQILPDVLRRLYSGGRQDVSETDLESAFAILDIDKTGRPTSHFDYLKKDEPGKPKGWREMQFAQAMSAGRHMPGLHFENVLKSSFNWAALGDKGSVVDIGGSGGHDAVILAQNFPNLKIITQDLPEQLEAYEKNVPAELRSRLSFQGHDFFKPEPILDADVYMLKNCLHDWPDSKAVEILKAVAVAVKKPNQRILLFENVMMPFYDADGKPSTPSNIARTTSVMDMFMLISGNGKERTLDDWKKLVKQVDTGLELVKTHSVPGVTASFLEIARV